MNYRASMIAPAMLAVGLSLAPPAQAAFATIFPNYSDGLCAGAGSVRQVKVAGIPGKSTIGPFGQRWARLEVGSGQVQVIAQLLCVKGSGTNGAWRTVVRTINNPTPWKSYYF